MKVIAITPRLVLQNEYNEVRDVLDIKWIDLLVSIGITPLIIPTGINYKSYIKKFNISGIIFTGGNTLSKLKYDNLSLIRDNKENSILKLAIDNKIPIFAVCRGMQIIADYFGCDFVKTESHVVKNHKINICAEFWGTKYISDRVNSYHNFAIKNLSPKLTVTAKAEDDTIEAFINKELNIYAQMWHPEREEPFKLQDIELIKYFFNVK